MKSAIKKGKLGENLVKNKLKEFKFLLNDSTIKIGDNHTTQIDHIVFTKKYIYVIETKHYSGKIIEKGLYWKQKGFKKNYTLYSPIAQNEAHIYSLSRVLNIDITNFKSIIVFTGSAKLKIKSENVIQLCSLLKYIKKSKKKSKFTLNSKKMYKIIRNIRMKKGKKTNKRHIKNLKR